MRSLLICVLASFATLCSAAALCAPQVPPRANQAKPLGQPGETGVVCDEVVCEETEIVLSSTPIEGMVCELQDGLEMDGAPVWACGSHSSSNSSRGGIAHMQLSDAAGSATDVSDLGLTMADLEEKLDPEMLGGGIESSGYQSTSRLSASSDDQGVVWTESATEIEAELTIPGLRGQPAGAMAVALTETTCTVTAFGMLAWSCILVDEVDAASLQFSADDGPNMVPLLRVKATKRRPGRWGGFLRAIGEDSVLQ